MQKSASMFPSHMFICTDCNGSDVSIESILISVLRGNQEATRNSMLVLLV